MKVAILDQFVQRNIACFKQLLMRQEQKNRKFVKVVTKTYRAYVNKETGDLFFEAGRTKKPQGENWKEIDIHMTPEAVGKTFEVLDPNDPNCFDCDMKEKAATTLSKTIHILNQISYDPIRGKNPLWIVSNLSHLSLEPHDNEDSEHLIQLAWHDVDRARAEYLLEGMGIGRFLFRKDEFAELLEETLNEELEEPITCFTLTYSDWGEKINEKIICLKGATWYFYDDDPLFRKEGYDCFKTLLGTMKGQLTSPLLHQ